MMEALSEAIRKQLSALAILDSTTSFKALVHNSILEQYGLMQKQEEYTDDDKPEDEEADFQEELQQHKQEDNDESLRLFTEGTAYKQRLKNIALVLGSTGGWFLDPD